LDSVEDYIFARAAEKNGPEACFALQSGGKLRKLLRRPLLGRIERGGVNHDVSITGCQAKAGAPVFPPGLVLGAHRNPGARDFLAGQAEVEEGASLMFSSVDAALVKDEPGVRDQDLIVTWRAKVLEADLNAGSAKLGQKPAGGAAMEVYTNRKLFPAQPQRRSQVRSGFDGALARRENLVHVWIAFQKVPKAWFDKYGGE
jgi:hypothetical protein